MTPAVKAAIERLEEVLKYGKYPPLTITAEDADAIALILADHARLQAENERMREALKPFADESLWLGPEHSHVCVSRENCDRARAARTPPATGERG